MKLSIGSKILALLGVSTLVGVGVAITSYRSTGELLVSSEWVSHTYQVIHVFDAVRADMLEAETGGRGFLITGEDRYLEPYVTGKKKVAEDISEVQKLTSDNAHQQVRIEKLKVLVEKKMNLIGQIVELRRNQGYESARKFVMTDAGKNAMDDINDLLTQASGEESDLLVKRTAENNYFAQLVRIGLLAGGGLFLIVFMMTAVFVRRGIVNPLLEVMGLATAISSGDLKQQPLRMTSSDEIGQLAAIFNNMLAFLRDIAAQNADVARNLGTAASEILAAIQQQAAAVREQAAAIQQTTTTMEEIGQSGAQVSERGRQVSMSAENTMGVANAGIGAVQSTNLTMVGIRSQVESVAENIVNLSERNQTIGEIIASVNDIAEQTNLLSLNAAIEAADAGDHGRRFSVVANELKNLSDQAKGATVQVRLILGEIQKGINTSVMLTEEAVKRAEGGKAQAELAEKTIVQLTGTTAESVKTFQQIVSATNQQQIGFEQITQALKSIRVGADQTAASTSQLEKAAMSLNVLGQQLQVSTQRYKT